MWFDNETTVADPGTYVQLPRALPHSILAAGGPVRALLIHDNDDFIDFIEEVGTPVADASTPPPLSPERVARTAGARPAPVRPARLSQDRLGRRAAIEGVVQGSHCLAA